jgi:hypothetical protein
MPQSSQNAHDRTKLAHSTAKHHSDYERERRDAMAENSDVVERQTSINDRSIAKQDVLHTSAVNIVP